MLSEIQQDLVARTRDRMIAVGPDHFNMLVWFAPVDTNIPSARISDVEHYELTPDCGFAACLGGFIAIVETDAGSELFVTDHRYAEPEHTADALAEYSGLPRTWFSRDDWPRPMHAKAQSYTEGRQITHSLHKEADFYAMTWALQQAFDDPELVDTPLWSERRYFESGDDE